MNGLAEARAHKGREQRHRALCNLLLDGVDTRHLASQLTAECLMGREGLRTSTYLSGLAQALEKLETHLHNPSNLAVLGGLQGLQRLGATAGHDCPDLESVTKMVGSWQATLQQDSPTLDVAEIERICAALVEHTWGAT